MSRDSRVVSYLRDRHIRRLVHFTPSRNLPAILAEGALRDVESMKADPFQTFAPGDTVRADGQLDKLSFSIEYPNAYYLREVRKRTYGYPDWAVLLLNPEIAATPGALFSPCNAALSGAPRIPGREGLEACYAQTISTRSRDVTRPATHDPRCPTDIQAEVQIPGPIPLSEVIGIVVETAQDAALERDRLRLLKLDPDKVRWLVSPGLFQTYPVFQAVRESRNIGIFDLDGRPA